MDFSSLKEKAFALKDKVLESSGKKIANTSLIINNTEGLNDFIKRSQSTSFTSEKTGETKIFNKRVIVIFCSTEGNFFKNLLIKIPVLLTKSFSQNIPFKICGVSLNKLKTYSIQKQPSLVIFETEKVLKTVEGEEKINIIIKSFSLNIEETIKNI